MSRPHRLPFPTALASVLAIAALLSLAACGDEGATTTAGPDAGPEAPASETPPASPHPIEFVKGLAAGVEAAGDPDALLFVYLARHRPT